MGLRALPYGVAAALPSSATVSLQPKTFQNKLVCKQFTSRAFLPIILLVLSAIFLEAAWPRAALAGTWNPTGSLNVRRASHTATLLNDGTVLVAGGLNDFSYDYINNVERYYPGTGWVAVSPLNQGRSTHTATLLNDGTVLVAGGIGSGGVGYLAHVEKYYPGLDWGLRTPMGTARAFHTATLLANGLVLVAGGKTTGEVVLNTTEIFNNTGAGGVGIWSPEASMNTARHLHTATLLNDGRILVAGGYNGASSSYASVEIYDPVTNAWGEVENLSTSRAGHTATLLPNGKVLVVGGHSSTIGVLNTAEVYDPVSDSWTRTANDLAIYRLAHTATLLSDGRVLVAGGTGVPESYNDIAELYSPATNTWSTDTPLGIARQKHTATRLADGRVLVAGGSGPWTGTSFYLTSAELYTPTPEPTAAGNPGAIMLLLQD